jgi:hypothetical protein
MYCAGGLQVQRSADLSEIRKADSSPPFLALSAASDGWNDNGS